MTTPLFATMPLILSTHENYPTVKRKTDEFALIVHQIPAA
jgi:hypothetical protein